MISRQKLIDALDKNSDKVKYHGYHNVYAESLPEKVDVLLEIGISIDGSNKSSLNGWSQIYPKAEIIGLDNDDSKLINRDNIKSYLVDQSSADSLSKFLDEWSGQADVIIDDGSHNINDYLLTYSMFISRLKKNGVYFIEDIWSGSVLEEVKSFFANFEDIECIYHDRTSTNNPDSIILEIRKK